MAPIIMVHGSGGEDGGWFNMTTPFQNYTNLPFEPFIQPFLDGKYPFDNSINLNPESTIQADGAKLILLFLRKPRNSEPNTCISSRTAKVG